MAAAPSRLLTAIGLKLTSALLFAAMWALVRQLSETTPVGQIVFFRSFFAIPPVLLIYTFRGELMQTLRTKRVLGQAGRGSLAILGMFTNFAALGRLALADVTAITFASPLITVALAALILKERVRLFRWSAVVVGFIGVIVMLIPNLSADHYAAGTGAVAVTGAILSLTSAICNGGTVIQTRRLTQTETTSSIVFYFSVMTTLGGLVTLPFAWHSPSQNELIMLISTGILGGLGHILLTESYRRAAASVIAPFDYSSMLWALLLGYWLFGELPSTLVYVGAAIVACAGLAVIFRERWLGLRRPPEGEGPRTAEI